MKAASDKGRTQLFLQRKVAPSHATKLRGMTPIATESADQRLRRRLARSARQEFWGRTTTIKCADARQSPFQYPAMMVSDMQATLLREVVEARSEPPRAYDPFLGSGATMLQAMRLGLPFGGGDINPLAVMVSRVRSGEAGEMDLEKAIKAVCDRAGDLRGKQEPPDSHWCRKWFREDVAFQLAEMRSAIAVEPERVIRRFLWICLAEIVRLSGNFRISTPKLQTRPAIELSRPIDVIQKFRVQAGASAETLRGLVAELRENGDYESGKYLPGLTVSLGDARGVDPLGGESAEVVITSPPYGDNRTTMPYGQASYLPLKWMDLEDLDEPIEPGLLDAIGTLDTRSLGGSMRLDSARVAASAERSPTLARLLSSELGDFGLKRVSSFFSDLDTSLTAILSRCSNDAHIVMTLGDRTVGGVHVPTTQIVEELLGARNVHLLTRVQRPLPRQKRLAMKNQYAATIRVETVLVMRCSGS